jgi:hypothetical protein
MSLPTMFQLYRGDQFLLVEETGVPKENHRTIYSNGDIDLWPNDPNINKVLPLPQRNHVAKFVKDPIYRTKVIMRKRPCCQNLYL